MGSDLVGEEMKGGIHHIIGTSSSVKYTNQKKRPLIYFTCERLINDNKYYAHTGHSKETNYSLFT